METILYAPIVKIDAEQRMVYGYASTEARDSQGEIVRRSALERALPDYLRFGNIREMHQPSAVGKAKEASFDDTGLWLGAKVVDDSAWNKVKEGVYNGFSIGGRVNARDPADKSIITGVDLHEISLVDRPSNPLSTFQLVKMIGGRLQQQPFQKWDCGLPQHQHTAKADAASCMDAQNLDVAKTQLAAARQSATGEELNMTTRSVDTTVGDAGKAFDQLASITKGDHQVAADAALKSAGEHDTIADYHEAEADKARVAKSVDVAIEHDKSAVQHREIADGYHDLHAHHLGHLEGDAYKAAAPAAVKLIASHGEIAKARKVRQEAFAALAKADATHGAHYEAMGKAMAASAEAHTILSSDGGALHQFTDLAAKPHSTVAGIDELAFKTAGIEWWKAVRADGLYKKDYSDDKRKEMAESGEAMSDGSYPIKDKGDLKDAIDAYGRAKDKGKAKAHITARAKALKATDELPADWDGSTKKDDKAEKAKGEVKCAGCGAMGKAKDDGSCPECGKPMTKADGKKTVKALLAVEFGDKALAKGMYLVAELARLLDCIRSLERNAAWEAYMEADDSELPAKLEAWLAQGADLLVTAVAEEAKELIGDDNVAVADEIVDIILEASVRVLDWQDPIRKAIETHMNKLARSERPAFRGVINKIALGYDPTKNKAHVQKLHDTLMTQGASCTDTTKAAALESDLTKARKELDTVTGALEKYTQKLVPVARDAQMLARENTVLKSEKAVLISKLSALENSPQPARLRATGIALNKGQDFGAGPVKAGVLETLAQIPPGAERRAALLKIGYFPQRS